ncbi:putative reverse transcriptase domain-containing protein [Tanacetum coccineum]
MAVNGGQGRRNQGNQAYDIHVGSRGGSPGPEHHDSGSFDMIIGMDWLSDHKAEIICHEKVVRIPLLDGKVLRVLGEKLEDKVFLDDLSVGIKRLLDDLGVTAAQLMLLVYKLLLLVVRVNAAGTMLQLLKD